MLTMLTQNSRPSTESYDELGRGGAGDGGITRINDLQRAQAILKARRHRTGAVPLHETLRQLMIAITVKDN
jgi:hypothetical protein